MNSRRSFLKIGGLAVVGGFVFSGKNIFSQTMKGGDYFSVPTEALASSESLLEYETFEPLVNTTFEIKEKNPVETTERRAPNKSLRLVEAIKHTYSEKQQSRVFCTGFTLIFQLETKGKLEDKIYRLVHPQTGEFSVFVSTVGRSGKRYQVVFSRAAV